MIKYVFYFWFTCFYYFSKNTNNQFKYIPEIGAEWFFIFTSNAIFYAILFIFNIIHLTKNLSYLIFILILLVSYIFTYAFFIKNKKYKVIVEEVISKTKWSEKKFKYFGILIILFTILLCFISIVLQINYWH